MGVRGREGIELARTLGHPFRLAHALLFEAVVLYLVGRGEALLRSLDDVMTLSHQHGFPFWLGLARVFRGATLIDSDPQAAVAEIGDGLSQAAATGNQAGAPPMIAMLALADRAAGQHAEAMRALELALAVSAQTGNRTGMPSCIASGASCFSRAEPMVRQKPRGACSNGRWRSRGRTAPPPKNSERRRVLLACCARMARATPPVVPWCRSLTGSVKGGTRRTCVQRSHSSRR